MVLKRNVIMLKFLTGKMIFAVSIAICALVSVAVADCSRLDPKKPLLAVPNSVYSSLVSFSVDPLPMKAHCRKLAIMIEQARLRTGKQGKSGGGLTQ